MLKITGQAETTPSSQSVVKGAGTELEVEQVRKGLQGRPKSNWEVEGKTKGERHSGNHKECVEEGGGVNVPNPGGVG